MILSLRDSELADIDCNRLIKRGVDAFACPVHEAKINDGRLFLGL